jgi:putative ATP-dependent endonuclease of OLD family
VTAIATGLGGEMFLEYVDIAGFRGINRLSLPLGQTVVQGGVPTTQPQGETGVGDEEEAVRSLHHTSRVLIGENAWGKSSLLDALTLLLSPEPELYCFKEQDFYFPPGEQKAKQRYLHVVLTFCEHYPGQHCSPRFNPLSPLWVKCSDRLNRIYYRLEGEMDDDGSVITWRSFLAANGQALHLSSIDNLAKALINLHPVLRLRDARFIRRNCNERSALGVEASGQVLAEQLDELMCRLVNYPQTLTNAELRHGMSAIQQLFEHYFAEQGTSGQISWQQKRQGRVESRKEWHSLSIINRLIASPGTRSLRVMLLEMFSSLLQAGGSVALHPDARPLLLVEDPETRLHPIMLSVAWGLLELLPVQRLTTTNSGELLSLVPIEQVCRLVRDADRVVAYRIDPQTMNAEEQRRIAFHIRFSRPSSLFARCWLLVEGETEVWLLNQFARQCGYLFESEGIKVIEFAQCGIKPLLHFAQQMGIEWHVLVDGDEAGKKYAAAVIHHVEQYQETLRYRLTTLPVQDIEHYLYREGFEDIFRRISAVPANVAMSPRRIIDKAIHRSSKPDLAIEIAQAAALRGVNSIPTMFKKMFSRLAWLARGRAD